MLGAGLTRGRRGRSGRCARAEVGGGLPSESANASILSVHFGSSAYFGYVSPLRLTSATSATVRVPELLDLSTQSRNVLISAK